jgi:hypothetical protein
MSDRLVEIEEQQKRDQQERERANRETCPRCGHRPRLEGEGCPKCGYGGTLLTPRTWILLIALLVCGAVAASLYHFREEPPPAAHTAALAWNGRVVQSRNHELSAGAPCKAMFQMAIRENRIKSFSLRIICGNTLLYDIDRLPREHRIKCQVVENDALRLDGDAHEYRVRCGSDKAGDRDLRLDFDTIRQRALVWREQPPTRVEVAIDRDDGVRQGPAVFAGESNFAKVVRREARVESVEGAAPVKPGDRCHLLVARLRGNQRGCRVHIACDRQVLYGGVNQGYTDCKSDNGRPLTALEQGASAADGDPRLMLDMPGAAVTVSDSDPDWQVKLSVEKPAGLLSCSAATR